MQKYFNNVVTANGQAVPGATVVVTTIAGGVPTLYSDNGITPLASNSLVTDSNGFFQFYAANGRYSLAISGSNINAYTLADIILDDPRQSVNETPSGLINGSNVVFTLANTPAGYPSVNVTGGVRQGGGGAFFPLINGVDFTVSGNTVTMATSPATGSNLVFTYGY